MKSEFRSWEQVNSLREVQALRRLNPHPNIIDLLDVAYDPATRKLDLVCELMDMNIYERIKNRKHHLPEALVKTYVYQLCKSLDHMHRNGIFHRDVKPENILIKDDVLKLADFGSCRGIYSKPPFTEYISTRWYRPPECLLTDGRYTFKMDMWSVGCVFFEVMSLYPLFPGQNELDQIAKIHEIVGTPSDTLLAKMTDASKHTKHKFAAKEGVGLKYHLPHASDECLELMEGLLKYDPEERFSARQALKHPYFKDLKEADKLAQRRLKGESGDVRVAPTTQSDQSPKQQPRKTSVTSHTSLNSTTKSMTNKLNTTAQGSTQSIKQTTTLPSVVHKSNAKPYQSGGSQKIGLPPAMQTGNTGKTKRRGKQPAQPKSISMLSSQARTGYPMTSTNYGGGASKKKAGAGATGGGDNLPPIALTSSKTGGSKQGTKSYAQPGGHLPKLGAIKDRW